MYPKRDFRFLIDNNPESAIRAISREHLSEILKWWVSTDRPQDKYKIYNQGIYDAIAKGRYPCIALEYIKDFPEFHSAVRDGLSNLWLKLRFSIIYGDTILIDSALGEDVDCDKLDILYTTGTRYSILLNFNGETHSFRIVLSKHAEEISYKFHWFYRSTHGSEKT